METKGKIKVLIVDDEDRFRETTAAILTRRGFAVEAVGSGSEALEAIRKDDVDVVVLDIKMPGMDGHEALREIKKLKPQTQIIMLTGHGTPDSALVGLQDGVFDYLSKPCDIELLSLKIREAFAREQGVSEAERRVRDVMVPLSSYSTVGEESTVEKAIELILESFEKALGTGTVKETGHRDVLVLDGRDRVIGILTFADLLAGLQPPYMQLLRNRPSMADSIRVEPPSHTGMFSIMTRDLLRKQVGGLMSHSPPKIRGDTNLMEAANRMIEFGVQNLLVVEDDKAVGVIRDQDLFFELAAIIKP
jgi:CheY-like chemotaxis protein